MEQPAVDHGSEPFPEPGQFQSIPFEEDGGDPSPQGFFLRLADGRPDRVDSGDLVPQVRKKKSVLARSAPGVQNGSPGSPASASRTISPCGLPMSQGGRDKYASSNNPLAI